MALPTFTKLPLGGVDRRALVALLAEQGAEAARGVLAAQRATLERQDIDIADDAVVLILGGSNGITRSLATQLLLAERIPVVAVHYDSAKMQIGVHHTRALGEAAAELGVEATFLNRDATRDKTIAEVVESLAGRYRAVHLINGIAAGATKRYEKHGPIQVRDLDMAFDPVLQVPDFARREAYRKLGMVDVGVATQAEIDRTNKLMGTSSLLWAEPLAQAGLLVADESVVAFCDYDFPADDPVYAMGPLAGAKLLQRETMSQIEERCGVRTVRLCYPAMPTTALGAIPGGTLMYALTAQILAEHKELSTIDELASATMALWKAPKPRAEIRLDVAYQAALPELQRRLEALSADDVPNAFGALLKD